MVNLLVIGSGGREHALVWKLRSSPSVNELLCAPGNAGIAEIATCVNIDAENISALADLAEQRQIDLTIVGPEAPLVAGIVDLFQERSLPIFGPRKAAAQIEGSKVFCKQFLKKWNIPTANFEVFTDSRTARDFVHKKGAPIVIKADGLAAGKGVFVCKTLEDADTAIERIMSRREFGEAGNKIIIEECLLGQEVSIMVLTDGRTVKPLPPSQDHKALREGDLGPNTGGMGAYSPVPTIDSALFDQLIERILKPTIAALDADGFPYQGLLYAGLILTDDGPKVLEYNCRFGDPETQTVLPLLETDLATALKAVADERLHTGELKLADRASVCVVMTSGGYPGSYNHGKPISGLNDAKGLPNVIVFHAGTAQCKGEFVTNGGRVLGVTGLGVDFVQAIECVYQAVNTIKWDGAYHRTDIAHRTLHTTGS